MSFPSTTTQAALSVESGAQPSAGSVDELIGRVLNDSYLVEAVLGEGGMGRVYRARHTRIAQKYYALKVLHPEYARDPEQLARFQREAEAAATVSHPNVVGVFDVGRTADGYAYLSCELLTGTDLDALLEKKTRLEPARAVRICLQICDAVAAAHKKNVVHRDLKPQNVFLLADSTGEVPDFPVVKVVDFGLSRFLDHGDAQLTKTGMVMGTPAFMAPEQATGQRGDHRVDVYGIGVILYACLTGRPPFAEDTIPATLLSVITAEAPRPRSINPEIPEPLELLIQKTMAKNPKERYQSAIELASALSVFDPRHSLLPPGAPKSPERASRKSSHKSSLLHLGDDVFELKTSRPRLLFFSLLIVLCCIALAASALSGLELFVGPITLTRTELGLSLLGLTGTLAMPAFLGVRHLRRTIWSNSAKVIDLLKAVRNPLFAGIVCYGLTSIFLRFADEFVGRFAFSSWLLRDPGISWPGFTWILPSVALLAALLSYQKKRWSEGTISEARRHLLGAPLLTLTVVLTLVLVFLGISWRRADLAERAAIAEKQKVHELDLSPPPTVAPPTQPAEPKSEPQVKLATDEELASAVAEGESGLLPLAEKYPSDPRVLEPLLLSYATRTTGYADALSLAKRLIQLAPEKRDSEALAVLLRRGAEVPGSGHSLAFELMADRMGSYGVDLLYQLAHSNSKAKEKAAQLLLAPEVKGKQSPALRVLIELKEAPSCEARVPLLSRARSLGDSRSAAVLTTLAQGSKRGCGKYKYHPCPPTCKEQSKEFLEAATVIAKNQAASRL